VANALLRVYLDSKALEGGHAVKHPGLLTGRVILPQNNNYSHTPEVKIKLLEQFLSKCLAHPLYSPDIELNNIYHIKPPKKNAKEKHL
jgi:hypothetical protein